MPSGGPERSDTRRGPLPARKSPVGGVGGAAPWRAVARAGAVGFASAALRASSATGGARDPSHFLAALTYAVRVPLRFCRPQVAA